MKPEALDSSKNEHIEGGEHNAGGTNAKKAYKIKMHDELWSLVDKY